ncbi:MAG: hypothetical protein M1815_003827 [Lichina confinis]|nr:MAG: hypothetical protein M1815_003827 [Lichina confinis]
MVQGAVRKSGNGIKLKQKRNPAAAGAKKGARAIAPKRESIIKQRKTTKKHTASLLANLERKLAEKAGHTELLAKDKKKAGATAGKNDKPIKKT